LTLQITPPYIPENTGGVFGEFGWSELLLVLELFSLFSLVLTVSTAAQEAKPTKGMPIGILDH
jgi:hypothetical protein